MSSNQDSIAIHTLQRRWADAEVERDEWKARALAAEADRNVWRERFESAWADMRAAVAAGPEAERDEARAEAERLRAALRDVLDAEREYRLEMGRGLTYQTSADLNEHAIRLHQASRKADGAKVAARAALTPVPHEGDD